MGFTVSSRRLAAGIATSTRQPAPSPQHEDHLGMWPAFCAINRGSAHRRTKLRPLRREELPGAPSVVCLDHRAVMEQQEGHLRTCHETEIGQIAPQLELAVVTGDPPADA